MLVNLAFLQAGKQTLIIAHVAKNPLVVMTVSK